MTAMNYPQQGGPHQQQQQQLVNGMMRPMGAQGQNGFPQQGGMPNMGNNNSIGMQMGVQPMGQPQMSPQNIAAQQQQVSPLFGNDYLDLFLIS
jgi:hypothetical protein